MEPRRIQQVGAGTLTVSIPREWVLRRKLRKGDRLIISEDGPALRLLPEAHAPESASRSPAWLIAADHCTAPGFLERVIVGNYVLGRDRIVIRAGGRLSSEHLEEIRRAARQLTGLGIIQEAPGEVVLECAVDPARHPITTLLRRLHQIGATMLQEALESLATQDPRHAMEALRREDDADSMYWLTLRLILSAQLDDAIASRAEVKARIEIPSYRLIARDLEAVADHATVIAKNVLDLLNLKAKVPPRVLAAYTAEASLVSKIFESSLGGLFGADLRRANEAIEMGKEMLQKDNEVIRLLMKDVEDPRVVLPLRVISGRMARMADYGASIAAVAFNKTLVRPSGVCKPLAA